MQENPAFNDPKDTIRYVMAQKIDAKLIPSNDDAFYSDMIPPAKKKAYDA